NILSSSGQETYVTQQVLSDQVQSDQENKIILSGYERLDYTEMNNVDHLREIKCRFNLDNETIIRNIESVASYNSFLANLNISSGMNSDQDQITISYMNSTPKFSRQKF